MHTSFVDFEDSDTWYFFYDLGSTGLFCLPGIRIDYPKESGSDFESIIAF